MVARGGGEGDAGLVGREGGGGRGYFDALLTQVIPPHEASSNMMEGEGGLALIVPSSMNSISPDLFIPSANQSHLEVTSSERAI